MCDDFETKTKIPWEYLHFRFVLVLTLIFVLVLVNEFILHSFCSIFVFVFVNVNYTAQRFQDIVFQFGASHAEVTTTDKARVILFKKAVQPESLPLQVMLQDTTSRGHICTLQYG